MRTSTTLAKALMRWYRHNARDLPWRRTADPYKIWISEVMLQQTTVNAVTPYYHRWTKKFPTVKDVARAPLQTVLKMWQGLGYYQRAKNVHKSAKIISDVYKGKIPRNPDVLKKLPGFGPYTVGAVLSIAFGIKSSIIDANIRRVIMRVLALKGSADATQDGQILKFLNKIMPEKGIGAFNQALMELGATVCRNREPLCLLCPVRAQCQAYKRGIQEIIPTPKKKILKDVDVVVGLIKRGGKYFIQKRPAQGLLADLWEFPGGKMEKGETALKALRRELNEELDVEVKSARHMMHVQHFYTQFRVQLNVMSCQLELDPSPNRIRKWVDLHKLTKYPMPSGSAKIVDRLLKDHLATKQLI
jgi:A/G-specific adenine glycosylase